MKSTPIAIDSIAAAHPELTSIGITLMPNPKTNGIASFCRMAYTTIAAPIAPVTTATIHHKPLISASIGRLLRFAAYCFANPVE